MENQEDKMLNINTASKALKKAGARMTAQRYSVLEILENNTSHPTVEEIVDQVKKKIGHVSIATIYNTLDVLEHHGLVRKIDGLEAKSHYDPNTSNHHHAICKNCKKVFDVFFKFPESNTLQNFKINEIVFQGLCNKCAN